MTYLDHQTANAGPVRPDVVDDRKLSSRTASFLDFGGKSMTFSAHEVIYYEGDPAKRLYQLDEGAIMLFKLLPDGRRQVVEVLRPGDIFGLAMAEEHGSTAETLTDSKVYEVDPRHVIESPELHKKLTQCLMQQMNTLHDHAVLLGRKSAMERVSSFFMYLIPNRGGVGCMGPDKAAADDGYDLTLHMTRQEIADYLGLTIETVSRVVSELKRKGVIRIDRADKIHLNRVCGLCRLTGIHD